MANTLLTPDIIAREALMILQNNTVMGGLVYRDYEGEFGPSRVGDTISIRKPAAFTAKEFTSTIDVQDAKEQSVALTLEKHFDVSTSVTSKEWTLDLDNFSTRIIAPAMVAINDAVDSYLCSLYQQFNQTSGTAGTMPSALSSLAALDQAMNEAKIPVANRKVVVNPATKAAMFSLDAVARADARGDEGTALREASMGRIMGMDWYMDQNIKSHTAGTASAATTLAVNGAVSAGATTLAADGGTGSQTLKVGDVFTVAGASGSYTVTANATATAGAFASVAFMPAAPTGGFADDAVITVKASHVANLAFVKEAIALAAVPLEIPQGAANAAYVSMGGLGIRVVYGYDVSTKTDTISFDLLCGAKVIDPRLGVRFLA